ncbi:hypothetical protein BDV09DRAFT_113190 [Aspergillus tetrazonus]
MTHPLDIYASELGFITTAIQSANALKDTVRRVKEHGKELGRLQHEPQDLSETLSILRQVGGIDASVLADLQRPIERCNQSCQEFEDLINKHSTQSTPGFRDWAKLRFMGGDIDRFINALAVHKSTISIGLDQITMRSSKVSNEVPEEYMRMIEDVADDSMERLQRNDEKLSLLLLASVPGVSNHTHSSPHSNPINPPPQAHINRCMATSLSRTNATLANANHVPLPSILEILKPEITYFQIRNHSSFLCVLTRKTQRFLSMLTLIPLPMTRICSGKYTENTSVYATSMSSGSKTSFLYRLATCFTHFQSGFQLLFLYLAFVDYLRSSALPSVRCIFTKFHQQILSDFSCCQ